MALHDFDVLFIGGGLSSFSTTIHLARSHRVPITTKQPLAMARANGPGAALLQHFSRDHPALAAPAEPTVLVPPAS